MTLICCQKLDIKSQPHILLATDSMLGAGYRWPTGPKVFLLSNRQDSVLTFEGDTEIAYPLFLNAFNFINNSDYLGNESVSDPVAVASRICKDISEAYNGLSSEGLFNDLQTRCSFLFVGWSKRLGKEVIFRFEQPTGGGISWTNTNVEEIRIWQERGVLFLGNGDHDPVAQAEDSFRRHSGDPLAAYQAFISVLDDPDETAVGGQPQIVLFSESGRELIGIKHLDVRYLFGLRVRSGATSIRYLPRDLSGLL